MSEDLTKKLPQNDTDTILKAIKDLETYVRSSIDNLITWISSIDARLRALEQTVEQRLYDTRPMWHKLVDDVSQLQTGQNEMRSDLLQVKDRLQKVEHRLQNVDHRLQNVDHRLQSLEINRN